MTLEQFRINHSILIEHYQFIEWNLEGIYASLKGKGIYEGMQDVDKDNISRLVNRIRKVDKEGSILSEDDFQRILEINGRRNFYVHNCYVDMVFDRKTDAPKEKHIPQFLKDIRDAENLREYLFDKKMKIKVKY